MVNSLIFNCPHGKVKYTLKAFCFDVAALTLFVHSLHAVFYTQQINIETQCVTFFLLINQNVLNYFNCHEFVYIYINYLHTDKIRLLCKKKMKPINGLST